MMCPRGAKLRCGYEAVEAEAEALADDPERPKRPANAGGAGGIVGRLAEVDEDGDGDGDVVMTAVMG